GGETLANLSVELDVPLLFHVSEPVGHVYPGKEGLALATFDRFVRAHPGSKAIGAHWGGGLPFHSRMPEVQRAFEGSLWVDTAAGSLLYDETVYAAGRELIGARRILFGSDYPLL